LWTYSFSSKYLLYASSVKKGDVQPFGVKDKCAILGNIEKFCGVGEGKATWKLFSVRVIENKTQTLLFIVPELLVAAD
jgi:hypothetical protein